MGNARHSPLWTFEYTPFLWLDLYNLLSLWIAPYIRSSLSLRDRRHFFVRVYDMNKNELLEVS